MSCANGQILKTTSGGLWVCGQDNDSSTSGTLPVFIKHVTIKDDVPGNAKGWIPGTGSSQSFVIDDDVTVNSIVTVSIENPSSTEAIHYCQVHTLDVSNYQFDIGIACELAIENGSTLHYTVIKPNP